MTDLKYTTSSGTERTIKNVSKGIVSDNHRYPTFKGGNGKTYHWFSQDVVNGRVVDDVMTIETKSNWCRHLGTESKYSH